MMPDASTARAGLQRTRACSGCQGMRVLAYGTLPSRAAALSGVPQRRPLAGTVPCSTVSVQWSTDVWGVCHTFAFEVICGMISLHDQGTIMRE
jgi:hypothetical protein